MAEVVQASNGDGLRQKGVGLAASPSNNSGTALAAFGVRQVETLGERAALHVSTYLEAHATIQKWIENERKLRRQTRKKGDRPLSGDSHPSSALIAAATSHALVGKDLSSISRTPLEDLRRSRGLHHVRETIYAELARQCSLSEGLSALDRWTTECANKRCATVTDARELFPNLTLTEIAFLPLLERLPVTVQICGTGFDALQAKLKEVPDFCRDEPLSREELAATPAQLELRPDGIAFGTEHSRLGTSSDENASSLNPRDKEVVAFRPEVREVMERLVPLVIDADRLFEIVRLESTDALPVGVGRIRQAALARAQLQESVIGSAERSPLIRPTSPASLSLKEELQRLNKDQKAAVEAEEQRIANMIIRAKISYDGQRQVSIEERVHLLGILCSIPRCLLGASPFQGSILFDGANMLFADKKGAIVEVCPLQSECRDILRGAILSEQWNSSDTNRTMLAIHQELLSRVQSAIFQPIIEGAAEHTDLRHLVSPIEEAALSMYRKFGVSVLALGEQRIVAQSLQGDAGVGGSFVTGATIAVPRLKLSLMELEQIEYVLSRLGPRALQNVRTIYKSQGDVFSCGAVDRGCTGIVHYVAGESALNIVELHELPYINLRPEARMERAFQIAFAVGLSLYPFTEHEAWVKFRAQPGGLDPENLLYPHAKDSAAADFAASFAAYHLCLPDFEAKARKNAVILKKLLETQRLALELGQGPSALREGALSLEHIQRGLRAQFPSLPDTSRPEAVVDYLRKQADLADRRAEELSGDEDNPGSSISTLADRQVVEERQEFFRSIAAAVEELIVDWTEGEREEFCERLGEILEEAESLDDIRMNLRDLIEDYPGLSDDEEDSIESVSIESVIACLIEAGLAVEEDV